MTKAEIVEDIATKTGLTKKDVATAMDQFLESISKALAEGKHYEIRGFGTFKVKARKARMAPRGYQYPAARPSERASAAPSNPSSFTSIAITRPCPFTIRILCPRSSSSRIVSGENP